MSPEMKPKPGGEIKISQEKFVAAMDRIASDPEFRKKLEEMPVETLTSIGIEFDKKTLEHMKGKKLSQLMEEEKVAKFPWVRYVAKVATAVVSIKKS